MRTLVQAGIVALVLGLVGGVLIATVPRAQDAAARMGCSNCLKQIGLAIHNHASTYEGRLPPATEPNPKLPPQRRLSWLVAILPYVEANDLYSRTDHKKSWDAEENRFLALTVYKPYLCPGFPEQLPVSTLLPAHYIGIAGLGDDAASLPARHPRAGFFGHDRNLYFADLKGHTSTLLVAMETRQVHGAWTAGGPPTVRGLDEDGPSYLGQAGQFGGIHRGGTMVLFADGSVRWLSTSHDPAVLELMATLDGSARADEE
jgi:prepilin-type processing-associated H-X9-DG protein